MQVRDARVLLIFGAAAEKDYQNLELDSANDITDIVVPVSLSHEDSTYGYN